MFKQATFLGTEAQRHFMDALLEPYYYTSLHAVQANRNLFDDVSNRI